MLERRGWGAYGAVYRAFGAREAAGPVALKLALHPRDERFAREAELLTRVRHPSVPRRLDHGNWAGRCPGKTQIPINGGCWVELNVSLKDCDPNLNYIVYKGACYGPTFAPARPPTSGSVEPSGDDAP